MHSFRLYLINAIYILTFPYRFVNIYFCVFSDFFRFWSFFIDKSSKALNPPAQNGLPKTELRPPCQAPCRQPQRVSAEPRARRCFRAAPHGGQADRHEVKRHGGKPAFPTPAAYCRPAVCLCVAANACPKTARTPGRTAAPHGASNRHAKKTAQLNAEVIWGNARAYAACPFGIP